MWSLCHTESRLPTRMCQRHGSTSLRQRERMMNDLSVPKAVCLSLLGLLAASSPRRTSLNPFPLPHFKTGYLVAELHSGEHPLEPAQGFTLPWVDRSLAQCGSMRRHAPNFHNTPPSGRRTPRYELKGYQFLVKRVLRGEGNSGDESRTIMYD